MYDAVRFETLFAGWKLLDYGADRDIYNREEVRWMDCRHRLGYEQRFVVKIKLNMLSGDLVVSVVNQIHRQMAMLKRAVNPIPAEAVNAPEVQEDEEPEWTPEHCPEVWK